MNLIDALLGEHAVLYAEIRYLEAALSDMQSIDDIQASIAVFAAGVQSHSNLEDTLLFVSLERQLGAENGVVQSMRRMHADIEAAFERLPGATEPDVARETAAGAVALAREHFSVEEEACFPLAEDILSEQQLARLGGAWAERRGIGDA